MKPIAPAPIGSFPEFIEDALSVCVIEYLTVRASTSLTEYLWCLPCR